MLREEARRLLEARAPLDGLRGRLAAGGQDDPALWAELAEGGWLGLGTDAAFGGAGLGAVELVSLAEESGRVLLASPLLGQLFAAALIGAAGSEDQKAAWLPRLVRGEVRMAWAPVDHQGAWRVADSALQEKEGQLSGARAFVWAGDTADAFLVPCRRADGLSLAVVPVNAAGLSRTSETTLDPTRAQGRLRLDGVVPDMILEADAAAVEADFLPLAWTAMAAESVGGASATLDMTARYAAEREQFGKPIGSFQAIKHPLANVLIAVEKARSLVYAAACALDQGNGEAPLLARMARVAADEAYGFATSRAIQFHGGFGFTDECDAHLFRRRAMASRVAFGSPAHHRQQIGALILGMPSSG